MQTIRCLNQGNSTLSLPDSLLFCVIELFEIKFIIPSLLIIIEYYSLLDILKERERGGV